MGQLAHLIDLIETDRAIKAILPQILSLEENQTDRDGHTSQRLQNRPLDPLTQDVPPTGQTDDLRGPTCSQNGYSHCNDLETCKDSCKRTIKEKKVS